MLLLFPFSRSALTHPNKDKAEIALDDTEKNFQISQRRQTNGKHISCNIELINCLF